MRNLKSTIGILSIVGLAFTSCMDNKKENQANTDEVEMKSEMDSKTNINSKGETKRQTVKSASGKLMASNDTANSMITKEGKTVERSMSNSVNAMQISGWDSFNALSIEMKKLEGAEYNTVKSTLPKFGKTIASLNTTRPDWMKTEEIREDIEDVQKEYSEFIEEQNEKEKEVKENIEELNEAYSDLVEEINETFNTYVKINRKATEEFREEMQDDGDTDDAREEYNEEIKKLKKVADDKK